LPRSVAKLGARAGADNLPTRTSTASTRGLCTIAALIGLVSFVSFEARAGTTCAPALLFKDGIEVTKAVRVYTGADGQSAFEDVTYKGGSKAYFKPGELFSHVNFGAAAKVQLVQGPPNVVLAPHPSPYKEMFMTLQGSSTVVLPGGARLEMRPGVLVIFDDMTSKTGHGGLTGPCGYVALNIVPPPASDQIP
jgi:hypothetical protein